MNNISEYQTEGKPPDNIICEPLVKYDAIVLDPAKRYSYADYLTWIDDKRRELFDGIVTLMSGMTSSICLTQKYLCVLSRGWK